MTTDEPQIIKDRDARWTYLGQSTWMLQIAPKRYLIRSTYRNVLDGGASMALLCLDSETDIAEFLRLAE